MFDMLILNSDIADSWFKTVLASQSCPASTSWNESLEPGIEFPLYIGILFGKIVFANNEISFPASFLLFL